MPLEIDHVKGTEKDGSRSLEYCIYCYENGDFKDPSMSLAKMLNVVETQMGKMNIPEKIIETSLNKIPKLKRWRVFANN
jgi:hypothetical protein